MVALALGVCIAQLTLVATWAVYGPIVTGVEFLALCVVLGDPHDPQAVWSFLTMNFTQGAVVFAVMRIYRTLGYRLQHVPREVL
ncbi:MAG: hypothetical protein ACLP9L_17380 [Thermoguttaceae bacterium]